MRFDACSTKIEYSLFENIEYFKKKVEQAPYILPIDVYTDPDLSLRQDLSLESDFQLRQTNSLTVWIRSIYCKVHEFIDKLNLSNLV